MITFVVKLEQTSPNGQMTKETLGNQLLYNTFVSSKP